MSGRVVSGLVEMGQGRERFEAAVLAVLEYEELSLHSKFHDIAKIERRLELALENVA